MDNYDGTEKERVVFSARFPNLLVNGTSCISMGMASNIPTHYLGVLIDTVFVVRVNADFTVDELMEVHLSGPDFPTAGKILGRSGIRKAYETGRGSITLRAKVETEENSNGTTTVLITEIPYQVNKAKLIEKIA